MATGNPLGFTWQQRPARIPRGYLHPEDQVLLKGAAEPQRPRTAVIPLTQRKDALDQFGESTQRSNAVQQNQAQAYVDQSASQGARPKVYPTATQTQVTAQTKTVTILTRRTQSPVPAQNQVPPPAYTQNQVPPQACSQNQVPQQAYTQNQVAPQAYYQNQVPQQAYTQNQVPSQAYTQNQVPSQAYYQNQVPQQAYTQNQVPPQAYSQNQVPPQGYYQNQVPPQGYYQNQVPPQGYYQNQVPSACAQKPASPVPQSAQVQVSAQRPASPFKPVTSASPERPTSPAKLIPQATQAQIIAQSQVTQSQKPVTIGRGMGRGLAPVKQPCATSAAQATVQQSIEQSQEKPKAAFGRGRGRGRGVFSANQQQQPGSQVAAKELIPVPKMEDLETPSTPKLAVTTLYEVLTPPVTPFIPAERLPVGTPVKAKDAKITIPKQKPKASNEDEEQYSAQDSAPSRPVHEGQIPSLKQLAKDAINKSMNKGKPPIYCSAL